MKTTRTHLTSLAMLVGSALWFGGGVAIAQDDFRQKQHHHKSEASGAIQRLLDLMAAIKKVLMVATRKVLMVVTMNVITLRFDTVFMTGYSDGHTRTARTLGLNT
jgi:hypothetical protein